MQIFWVPAKKISNFLWIVTASPVNPGMSKHVEDIINSKIVLRASYQTDQGHALKKTTKYLNIGNNWRIKEKYPLQLRWVDLIFDHVRVQRWIALVYENKYWLLREVNRGRLRGDWLLTVLLGVGWRPQNRDEHSLIS